MRLPAEMVARLRPAFEGKPVCVTGGAGFIGGHLVDALLSLGASIAVIDDLSTSTADHLGELIELEPGRVRFVHGSILDPRALRDAVAGAQVIFHLAAMGSVPRSIEEPFRSFAVNAGGTVAVLEAAREAGSGRVIMAGSSSVYGGGGGPSVAEQMAGQGRAGPVVAAVESAAPAPLSPYAASKVAAEAALRAWCRCYGLSGLSLRYFNVFGPRQSAETGYAAVVPAFARAYLSLSPSREPVIFGDGSQSRDLTYVDNAVAATLLAGAGGAPGAELEGQAVNIGTGRRTTVLELAELIAQRARAGHVRPRFEPARPGDVLHSVADISLAKAVLGYAPIASLETGLDETVEWYRRAVAGV
jgi:nucleoside-diphosphate-sugar epimerase